MELLKLFRVIFEKTQPKADALRTRRCDKKN